MPPSEMRGAPQQQSAHRTSSSPTPPTLALQYVPFSPSPSSASPSTPRSGRSFSAVLNRPTSPPPPPPIPAFYLSPADRRTSDDDRSNSIPQSDISLAESSSSVAPSVSIPQPYGRVRKPIASAQPDTQWDTSVSRQQQQQALQARGPEPRASIFARIRQKVSTTSLRGRSVLNSAEPLPPVPIVPGSKKAGHSPVAGSFPQSSMARKGLTPGREKKAQDKAKRVRGSIFDMVQPIEDDGEPKTKSFLDHVDFDNLNPEDFIEFDAVPRAFSFDEEASETTPLPQLEPLPNVRSESETRDWDVPESWAVVSEEAMQKEDELGADTSESEGDDEDGKEVSSGGDVIFLETSEWVEHDCEIDEDLLEDTTGARHGGPIVEDEDASTDHESTMYALRVYRPNGTWHVVACRLTATAYEIRNAVVARFGLEEHGRVGRHRLFIVEKGQERLLSRNEKPVVMLRRRLIVAGHTKADNLSSQGGRELQHLCRFVLQVSALHGLADEYDGIFGDNEKVVLKSLNLQTIPAALHKHASHVISLSLKLNPITDLPKDFLSATTRLKKLIVSKTALKRVPPAISCCRALEFLDLSYNRITTLELAYGDLAGLAELSVLRLHCNSLKDLPPRLRALTKLRAISLSCNAFRTIPDVTWHLTALEYLDLSQNDVKELSPKLANLVRLRELHLAGNIIADLPREMQALHALETLDVSRNMLCGISSISGMRGLRIISASHNQIPNVAFPLPYHARVITLDSNPITRFSPDIKPYSGGTTLIHLDMSRSKLSSLQCDLTRFPNLEDLILDDSSVGELPPSVTKLRRLKTLSACNSSLKHLPDTIGDLKCLVRLEVHSNDLTNIPESIWKCRCLSVLNASSNKISSFPSPASEDDPLIKCLTELYLSNNRLTEDELASLSYLKALVILNLSYNCIRDLPDSTLRHHLNLEALYLSGNDLMAIRGEELPKTDKMTKLFLNNNRLQSLPPEIVQYHNLSILDVGYNLLKYNINNSAYDYQWIFNTELRFLNLSGNRRLKIDKPLNQKTQNVPADFRVLRHLELLGLMDVTLAVTFLPEESDYCRVRTTASTLNGMRYDVSDSFGQEGLASFDVVIPKFRGRDGESVFGIFSRQHVPDESPAPNNGLTRYLATHFAPELTRELAYTRNDPKLGSVPDALRRSFLNLNKTYYESVVNPSGGDMPVKSVVPFHEGDPASKYPELQTGTCACVAYLVQKVLYIANVGNAEVVLGRSGGYDTLSMLHTPFDAKETARIKRAEVQVAPTGLLRGDMQISRAFGFYTMFPVVNPSPRVNRVELTEDDHFMIIGNAELWSHLKKAVAVDIVRRGHVRREGMSAAQELRDIAISHGASGNVLVMVIMISDLFRVALTGPQASNFLDGTTGNPSLSLSIRDKLGSRANAPTGTLALVFTDIRNSTLLWEKYGSRMREAVEVHNKCLRRLLRLYAGYEVKTEGDSFMVSFTSLLGAVRWCLEVQLQLLNEEWPQEILESAEGHEVRDDNNVCIARGLSVRMGVHYGQPFCEVDPTTNRMDYLGPVVNRAARVNNCARGGEIMLSADVATLLRSQLHLQESCDEEISRSSTPIRTETPNQAMTALEDAPHFEAIRELEPVLHMIGERRLKGIELPEYLSVLFPKRLLGRHKSLLSTGSVRTRMATQRTELSSDSSDGPSMEDNIALLAIICKRLEALEIPANGNLASEDPSQYATLHADDGPNGASGRIPSRNDVVAIIPWDGGSTTSEQVMSTLQSLLHRIESSSTRLRLHHAVSLPEVRRVLIERAGIYPEELLQVLRYPLPVRTQVAYSSF